MKCDAPFAAKYLRDAGYSLRVLLCKSEEMYREENIVRGDHFPRFQMQIAAKKKKRTIRAD